MHPKYKLAYFRQQKWEPEWVETARELARDHYNKFYRPSPADSQTSESSSVCNLSVEHASY